MSVSTEKKPAGTWYAPFSILLAMVAVPVGMFGLPALPALFRAHLAVYYITYIAVSLWCAGTVALVAVAARQIRRMQQREQAKFEEKLRGRQLNRLALRHKLR